MKSITTNEEYTFSDAIAALSTGRCLGIVPAIDTVFDFIELVSIEGNENFYRWHHSGSRDVPIHYVNGMWNLIIIDHVAWGSIPKVYKDSALLPGHYTEVGPPYYKGDGMHSVEDLQRMCREFTEYCHQQQLVKQSLQNIIVSLLTVE